MDLPYEIRDPIHGFIGISEWERDILNHPVLQRLRRIRQLGLSEMVYPGSVHTRFEHSLGVMHVAARMFSEIRMRSPELLRELGYERAGLDRQHALFRITALIHDVGHAPFSHAAEELMEGEEGDVSHERYSAGIVKHLLREVIEDHPVNTANYRIRAEEVTALLAGEPPPGHQELLWRELISGQLDADRADYLLRDAFHAGVEYGRYDLERMLVCLRLAIDPETDSPRIAMSAGGWHVAEAFIIARYMMFTQVYFQHTRRAYDKHCVLATREVLERDAKQAGRSALLPSASDADTLSDYLAWDDWRVMGRVKEGEGGKHGIALLERKHFRRVFETPEVPEENDLELFESLTGELGDMVGFVDEAQSSWYRQEADALIDGKDGVKRLSQLSTIVGNMKAVNRHRIYVRMFRSRTSRANSCRLPKRKGGSRRMSESPLRCEIPWERYGLIAAIVRGLHPRSPQLGKTVLQKVVFLLQDLAGVPIGYRFQFYTYGPFSVELLQDLDLVEGLGGVKIHRVVSLTGGFEILPGDRADGLIRKAGNWLKEQGADDAITRIVADYGSPQK